MNLPRAPSAYRVWPAAWCRPAASLEWARQWRFQRQFHCQFQFQFHFHFHIHFHIRAWRQWSRLEAGGSAAQWGNFDCILRLVSAGVASRRPVWPRQQCAASISVAN